jgi:hypothetical protein
MKAFMAFAAAALATLSSGIVNARDVRTTFSFVVTIDGRVWPYNDNVTEDVRVMMPAGSPWHCIREKLALPSDGIATGKITCSSDGGRTKVMVSASCGLGPEDQHNSAVLALGQAQVTISVNCNTRVYELEAWHESSYPLFL